MFEALESRQFLSATALTDAPADVAPAPETYDTVAEGKKPKPKPTSPPQVYMTATMTELLVSSY